MLLIALALGCGVPCQTPPDLGADPLELVAGLDVNSITLLGGAGFLVHLIDLEAQPSQDRLYGVGSGGFWIFDTQGEMPDYLGGFREQTTDTYSRVAVLPDDHVVVLDRSTPAMSTETSDRFNGLRVLDVSDPDDVVERSTLSIEDASFLGADGPLVYVLRHSGPLEIYDASDPARLLRLASLEGCSNPLSMVLPDAQGQAWIVDADQGLVPVDLSDPGAPVRGEPIALAGRATDVARAGDQLFVGLGSDGLEVFEDLEDTPVSLGAVAVGGSVTQVSASAGLVWAAVLDGVAVLRTAPGTLPEAHGFEATERFSLCVEAAPDRADSAWGCAWSDLSLLQAEPDVLAPQALLEPRELSVAVGDTEAKLRLENRGGADLTVLAIDSYDRELEAALPDPVPSGSAVDLVLSFVGGFTDKMDVCVATDDPGEPVRTVAVSDGGNITELTVGGEAPDFSLEDVDGYWHTLSDYRGRPVLLIWFATW